jgi:hypothetical protein
MAFNLASLAAADPIQALPGALPKGIRKGTLRADFQMVLASSLAAQIRNSVPLLSTRTTLQRALTAALSPPGSGPPHPPSTASPPRDTPLAALITNAGQQNDIPGNILDANPAKEPPAQQKKPTHPQPVVDAAAAFARSIIAQASTSASSPAPAPASLVPPPHDSSGTPPGLPGLPQISDALSFAPSNAIAPAPPVVSMGSDVLARIVARASNAGAQHEAAAPVQIKADEPVISPAAAFEKLAAAIAQSSGSQSQSQTHPDDGSHSQSHDTQSIPQGNTGAQTASPAATASDVTASAKSVQPYTAVDINAVIEQVVKGIVIQNSGTSSQIRLRLQPEHLGEVTVKLTVSGNSISANVVAQNAGVRGALVGAQTQLSRSLADAGLSLGSFSVNVSGGNADSANERQQAQQHASGFKLGGWNASLSLNDDQPAVDHVFGPAQSGPRAIVINSLV